MKFNLKLGSALLIFLALTTYANAAVLTINNDGTGEGAGIVNVYDGSSVLVGSCTFPLPGCDAALATLANGNYRVIAQPSPVESEVAAGFSLCTIGIVTGNRCDINLTADSTLTATFNLRSESVIYDQDADGLDDLTELAVAKNPFVADGENGDGTYADTDADGIPDIVETNITRTAIGTDDSVTCTGTAPAVDLTGQWDGRLIYPDFIAAGHTLASPVDSTQEWLYGLSICHTTENGLNVYNSYYGYATDVTFDGTNLDATFTDPSDPLFIQTITAVYTPATGLFAKGRLEGDSNLGSVVRADRRMGATELNALTAANLDGIVGFQLTGYNPSTEQVITKAYNPGTDGFEISYAGGNVLLDVYDIKNQTVARGYFVPSTGSFFTATRLTDPAEVELDLDGDELFDDQVLTERHSSFTIVAPVASGVGGIFRGEFFESRLTDLDSDFVPDDTISTLFFDTYGKGVSPTLAASTYNIETSSGTTVVRSRLTLSNPPLSATTVTVSGGSIVGSYTLTDNTSVDPTQHLAENLTLRDLINGFTDGEKIGVHQVNEYNGIALTTKAENATAANTFSASTYTYSFSGPVLSSPADDLTVDYTDRHLTPLPIAANIRLDTRKLSRDVAFSRLINSDTSHVLTWNNIGPSAIVGSTGASFYRVRILRQRNVNPEIGVYHSERLEQFVDPATECSIVDMISVCSVTFVNDFFSPDFTFSIQIEAFDNADTTNRSISAKRYISSASAFAGCSNASLEGGAITNGSPCAEYYQVQNPRIYDLATVETAASLDYAVNRPVGTPKAIVVLLAGGNGNAGIIGDAGTKVTKQVGGNFLIRSAQMFADAGYLTISIDRPSDNIFNSPLPSSDYDAYRISPSHAQDIALVLEEVNKENLNVFLVGTSRGAISAVSQYALGTGIAISVPVNTNAQVLSGGNPVGDLASYPENVTVPVHYLTNPDELCTVTQPTIIGDTTIFDRFTGLNTSIYGSIATTNQFASLSTVGQITPFGSFCGSMHYHGFLGAELLAAGLTEAVWLDGILATIDANNVTRTRPTRRLALPLVATLIDTSTLFAIDPDGDAITYELPHATSSRGGTVTLVGTTLTYTPATAANTTDGFVVVATDGNGGRTSMLITMDVSLDADADGLPDSIYPADGSTADALADTDGDTLTLLQEYQAGTDPTLADPDLDGMDDAYELANLLDPNSATGNGGPSADPDGDGFTNLEESIAGSIAIVNSSSPGLFNFSSATYSVNEDAGTLSALVTRSGSVGAVSVLCFSTDIATQALSGSDYTSVSTTLNWANGDATAKTCDVPILTDADVETDETFRLDLSNPTGGAKLGPL